MGREVRGFTQNNAEDTRGERDKDMEIRARVESVYEEYLS